MDMGDDVHESDELADDLCSPTYFLIYEMAFYQMPFGHHSAVSINLKYNTCLLHDIFSNTLRKENATGNNLTEEII